MNTIDPNEKLIKHRLYRHHAAGKDSTILKDLSKLGRNLERLVFVDNMAENFKLHPDNGLCISSWVDNINDSELYDIGKILKGI